MRRTVVFNRDNPLLISLVLCKSIRDNENDPVFSTSSSKIHSLLFCLQLFIEIKETPFVFGLCTAADQLEKVGLRAILTTLYVFSPGASNPGDKPRLLNV